MTDQKPTVHVRHPDYLVVRYDRAGKWKRHDRASGKETPLTLSEAVSLAVAPGAHWREGILGGTSFDARVRKALGRTKRNGR